MRWPARSRRARTTCTARSPTQRSTRSRTERRACRRCTGSSCFSPTRSTTARPSSRSHGAFRAPSCATGRNWLQARTRTGWPRRSLRPRASEPSSESCSRGGRSRLCPRTIRGAPTSPTRSRSSSTHARPTARLPVTSRTRSISTPISRSICTRRRSTSIGASDRCWWRGSQASAATGSRSGRWPSRTDTGWRRAWPRSSGSNGRSRSSRSGCAVATNACSPRTPAASRCGCSSPATWNRRCATGRLRARCCSRS